MDQMRFQFLTAASMKMAVFWVVAPTFQRFCCLHQQGMMQTESTSKSSVNYYQSTRRNNPEDSHLPVSNCTVNACITVSGENILDKVVQK
jgi:hypothetical protein